MYKKEKLLLAELDPNDEANWDELGLSNQNSQYTEGQKITAATVVILTGSLQRAAKESGVPWRRVKKWQMNSPWWDKVVTKVRRQKAKEIDDNLSRLIDTCLKDLETKLTDGETVLNKNGDTVSVPLKTDTLLRVFNSLFDRRQVVRGDPTSISQSGPTNQAKILEDLQGRFLEFGKQMQQKEELVISEQ